MASFDAHPPSGIATLLPPAVYEETRARLAALADDGGAGARLRHALLRQSAITEAVMPPSEQVCLDRVVALRSPETLAAALGSPGELAAALGLPPGDGDPEGQAGSAVRELWEFAASLDTPGRQALEVLVRRAVDPLRALATVPMSVFFSPAESRRLVELLRARGRRAPGLLGVTVIMKLTRLCNLRCSYCHDWRAEQDQRMSFDALAVVLDRLFTGHHFVRIIWHGGEPLLLGAGGILKVLAAQAWLLPPAVEVSNSVQTNGTVLSSDLIRVLARYRVAVSVSMDGPPDVHDQTRRTAGGRGTADRVRRSIRELRGHGLLSGVLVVVTPAVIRAGAERLLTFLREEEIGAVGLLPARPESRADGSVRGPCLPVDEYCRFLLRVQRIRDRMGDPRPRVRELDAVLGLLDGRPAGFCELQGDCLGRYFSVEPNGDVAHCDKFVGDPDYTLGNLAVDDLTAVRGSARLSALRTADTRRRAEMEQCPWYGLCRGWCPHEAYVSAATARADGRDAPRDCCGLSPLFSALAAGRTPPAGLARQATP
ncbi:radical SAM protein [Microbispora sp. NPDC046973]|uniref:radical SAM/SPASM domain-containing protein n=1 Tax=Microbispora sp. NPDC046973 TaxID=3155022 RepID=UPI0033D8F30B